jgi:hypothetical protein
MVGMAGAASGRLGSLERDVSLVPPLASDRHGKDQ